jgi:hypothetical protein
MQICAMNIMTLKNDTNHTVRRFDTTTDARRVRLACGLALTAIMATAMLLPRSAHAASPDAAAPPASAASGGEISAAEQALFLENQLGKLKPPLTLHFNYRKAGSLEAAFDDKVDIALVAKGDGSCCTATAQFFTGARQMRQPEVEATQGNPAILYFLERDIREMERLTKGKANYFRKRIRMAVFQGATIRNTTMPYKGKAIAVREVNIAPYLDDPNRSRFEKLANKQYQFILSDAVPGGLYGIRTRIDADSTSAPPLMTEDLLLDGAEVAAR